MYSNRLNFTTLKVLKNTYMSKLSLRSAKLSINEYLKLKKQDLEKLLIETKASFSHKCIRFCRLAEMY